MARDVICRHDAAAIKTRKLPVDAKRRGNALSQGKRMRDIVKRDVEVVEVVEVDMPDKDPSGHSP